MTFGLLPALCKNLIFKPIMRRFCDVIKFFRKDQLNSSYGGVAVVVQTGVPCSEVLLCTQLEALVAHLLLEGVLL